MHKTWITKRKTKRSRYTVEQAEEIVIRYRTTYDTYPEIAKDYDCSWQLIQRIVNGSITHFKNGYFNGNDIQGELN